MQENTTLDKYDRNILNVLQDDGRISYTDLGKRVLSAKQLDKGLVVFVQISLDRTSKKTFEDFRRSIQKVPSVQECYLVTCSFDFLVKARIKDMAAYRDLLEGELLNLPGVKESTSIAAMEIVKETLEIDL